MTALLALAALAVFGVAGAAAEDDDPVAKPPPYNGTMSFPMIKGPEGDEEYSWTVQLGFDQELLQVDDRSAVIKYDDGAVALTIEAGPAHDAVGTSVPTTLAVSEGDVITLAVHHRAGNPSAGGAPFYYPVTPGAGWEGGFVSYRVQISYPEPEAVPSCVVPKLGGRSLAASRTKLTTAGCKLGAIRGKRGRPVKRLKVVKQFRDPGTVLGAGAKVAIKLG